MSDSFALDHVVIAVHDLDVATRDYRDLGFTVFSGGEHRHRGSHNALITFQDGSYIELIAFRHEPPVRDNDWWDLLQQGEGLVDVAVIVPDVDDVRSTLTDAGIEAKDLVKGGRDTPDGDRIAWRVLRAPRHLRLPFFIDDVTPRERRVPIDHRASHANGITGVARVTVASDRVPETSTAYTSVFGSAGPEVAFGNHRIDLIDADQHAPGVRDITFTGGTVFAGDTHGAHFRQRQNEQDSLV